MTSTNTHDRFHETVQQRIKRLRQESGHNQGMAAKLLGVSQNALSSIELGQHWPSLPTAIALAKLFNVSLDYMCCVTDNRTKGTRMIYQMKDIHHRWIDCSEEAYTTKLQNGGAPDELRIVTGA